MISRTVAAESTGFSGTTHTGRSPERTRERSVLSWSGSARLMTMPTTEACSSARLSNASSMTCCTSSGRRSRALTVRITGAPMLAAMRPLMASSAGPATSV